MNRDFEKAAFKFRCSLKAMTKAAEELCEILKQIEDESKDD